jgi:pimeloyl-ACP methyl ester carboxylesterase
VRTIERRDWIVLGSIALIFIAAVPAKAADLLLQTGYVEHDGERLYYESVGSGDAIVLSHGAGGTHAVWYQQVPEFAKTHRVIIWDLRGFGRSTDNAKQSGPATSVEDLAALLEQLKIDRAHIVGQSAGGWTAMGFALKYPGRVRSLVLADTLGGVVTPQAQAALDAARRSPPDIPNMPITKHPGIDDSLGARDPAKAFLYREVGSPAPEGFSQRTQATKFELAAVRELRLPVLFIVGERDTAFPPAAIRAVAAEIKGSQVALIPGTGHSPYFETPREWNAVYAKFLGELRRK